MNGPSYQVVTQTIPANSWSEFVRQSDYFVCLDASDTFKVAFDDYPATNWEKGLKYAAPQPFFKVRFVNQTDADITVKCGFGLGGIDDARFVFSGTIDTRKRAAPNLLTPALLNVAASGNVEAFSANTSRQELGLRNLSTTQRVWINEQAAQGASGWPLEPQEGLILTTQSALYVHNASGENVQIARFELEGI